MFVTVTTSATSPERIFSILEMFERERRPLSLKELSEYCQIPTSTCHALVHTLLKRAYLYQTGHRKELYPTRRLYDMGATIVANDVVLQRLLPVMEALRKSTQETVILGKRHQDSVIYLEVLEGPQTIRYSARVGEKKPLHSTCIGKTILSGLKPEEVRQWLDRHSPQKVTKNTITTYARLMDNLEQGNKLGYFVTRGENVADVTAVSIPVSINNQLYGLAVAGPSHRVDARFDEVTQALKNATKSLLDQRIADHSMSLGPQQRPALTSI
jgi:IclR family acetate operon transcriptional repressor